MADVNFKNFGLVPVDENQNNEPDYASYGLASIPPDTAPQQPQNLPNMVNTFLGQMPEPGRTMGMTPEEFQNQIKDMIDIGAGAPGMKIVGKPSLMEKAVSGVKNLGEGFTSLFKPVDFKGLSKGVQSAHDTLLNQSSDIYNFIKSEVVPRGVSVIDVGKDLIKQASEYLPKTKASKELIKRAGTGDYQALHELQSDLGKRGTKALGAEFQADRNLGEEMLDVREKVNEAIRNQFHEYGQSDLVKLLDEATGKYRKLKEIYYSNPAIAKLVHAESRLIPKNAFNLFSEESAPMNKFLQEHPEIAEAVQTTKKAKDFKNTIGKATKVGVGASVPPALIYGPDFLRKILGNSGE